MALEFGFNILFPAESIHDGSVWNAATRLFCVRVLENLVDGVGTDL